MRMVAFLIVFFGLVVSTAAGNPLAFEDFPSGAPFSRAPHKPVYSGRDKALLSISSHIDEAISKGPNFASKYSVAEIGCGSGCNRIVVINNQSGRIFSFPRGGEGNQSLVLQYNVKSKLIFARWFTDSLWETCVIEAFVIEEDKWLAGPATGSNDEKTCNGDISAASIFRHN